MTVLGQSSRFRLGAQQSPEEEEREQNATDSRWSQRLNVERKERLRKAHEEALAEAERLATREKRWGWLLRPARRVKSLFLRAA